MRDTAGSRALVLTTTFNVLSHVAGLLAALVWMRPGTPLVPLEARMTFLAGRPPGWSLGWGAWMLCSLALVAFLAVLRQYDGAGALTTLSLVLAAAGAGIDQLCDALQIVVLPMVAAGGDARLFLVCERGLDAGGLVPANGLYSIACLLSALALRKRVPAHAHWLGVGTFAGGMLMVCAGFTGDPLLLQYASGATMVVFLAWSVAVARALLLPERG